MGSDYDYEQAYEILQSGAPYALRSVARQWEVFSACVRQLSVQTRQISDEVTARPGAPYQAFGERAEPISVWLNNVADQAVAVVTGLNGAAEVGERAQMRADELHSTVNGHVTEDNGEPKAMTTTSSQIYEQAKQQAVREMNTAIDDWGGAYQSFDPGQLGAAPVRNGGDGSAGSAEAAGSAGDPGAAAGGGTTAHSSVVGPQGGDFAGWVRDPRDGTLIDPASGQQFDPTTGRWIDPVTGRPYGDVQQYASRLEGLSGGVPGLQLGGPGSVALGPLGGGGVPGGAVPGLAPPLFGGTVPPSLNPVNPANARLSQQAANSMAAKAFAARQLAAREAAHGGRPYTPPMQGGAGDRRRARAKSSLVREPSSTWTGRDRRPYAPATRSGTGEDSKKSRAGSRPEWLVEDDGVWGSGEPVVRGVIGEER